MIKLIYDKIKKPTDDIENNFNTEKIFNENHRLGKDYNNQPSILFNTKDKDKYVAAYKGENIKIRYNVNCKIYLKKEEIDANYTILTCISEDEKIKEIFLEICEATFANISTNPTTLEIEEKTNSIIDLFKDFPNKQNNLLGFWGELFLIASSKDIKKTLNAWHNENKEKYDFYDNNIALEVKTTIKRDKKHVFGHDQLISSLKDHYIASIMTQYDNLKGLSVTDLYNEILKIEISDELRGKLKRIYFKIIGSTPSEIIDEYKFDYNLAKRNISYYKVSELTKIINKAPAISKITYTLDLSQNNSVEIFNDKGFLSNLCFSN